MPILVAFFAGILFGLGLIISGMTNPAKIIHFLDITGLWDPSLAFVMLGAIPIAFIGFRYTENKQKSYFGETIAFPKRTGLDKPLLLGAALFGIGWGLAGYCPGPAIVSLGYIEASPYIFVIAMVCGMWIYQKLKS